MDYDHIYTSLLFENALIVVSVRKRRERKTPYELADPLPEGEVMKDLTGNLWKLGKPFATGGFGLIYEGDKLYSITTTCWRGYFAFSKRVANSGPLTVNLPCIQNINNTHLMIAAFDESKRSSSGKSYVIKLVSAILSSCRRNFSFNFKCF